MKKFGFFALLAAVLLTACGPKETPVAVNSIKLSETTLTLTVGGDTKLVATTDPAGQEVTWASSNTAVATVKANGLVQGVGEGEAVITATAGDKSATCKVTVSADAAYDQFNIADWGLFGEEPEMIPGTDTVLSFSFGDATCQLGYITLLAWDGDLQYNNGWAGAGLLMSAEVPVYWIMDGAYKGYYVGAGGFSVGAQEGAYCAHAGFYDVDTYGKRVGYLYGNDDSEDAYTEDDNALYFEKNGGTICTFVDADGDNWNMLNYGLNYAYVNRAIMLEADEEEGTASAWAADLTWVNWTAENRQLGFLIDHENEDGSIAIAVPYDFSTVNKVYDENELFTAAAPARVNKLGDMSRLHHEKPMINGKALDATKFHMAR